MRSMVSHHLVREDEPRVSRPDGSGVRVDLGDGAALFFADVASVKGWLARVGRLVDGVAVDAHRSSAAATSPSVVPEWGPMRDPAGLADEPLTGQVVVVTEYGLRCEFVSMAVTSRFLVRGWWPLPSVPGNSPESLRAVPGHAEVVVDTDTGWYVLHADTTRVPGTILVVRQWWPAPKVEAVQP